MISIITRQTWELFYEYYWRMLLLWDEWPGLPVRTERSAQGICVRRMFLLNPCMATWVKPSGKAPGRLIPSHSAALSPSSWNRSQLLAHPADPPGCPLVILLETPPATLLCCSANSWWTGALARGASPWHTHPGNVNNSKPLAWILKMYVNGFV